jgi:tetratricopeptide (TPR) repeat protein
MQEEFPEISIFWVHASNAERFHQAFSQIAQSCQIPSYDDPKADILNLVKAWLERKGQRPWFMIIDNADDTEIFFSSSEAASHNPGSNRLPSEGHLGHYLPECSHGSILITTRNKQTGIKLTRGRGVIEVPQMDPAESSQLIEKKLEGDNPLPHHVSLLAARLENLPLALVQAAAFIQENSIAIIKYLQILEQSDNALVELLSEPFEEEGRDSSIPNAVAATWIVSFEQIRTQCCLASDLLSLMSFFDRQGIPKIFLSHVVRKTEKEADHQSKQEGQQNIVLELEKALGLLKAFSFVSKGKDDESLNIHRLLQLVMRKWLINQETFGEWASKAASIISDLYPSGRYEERETCSLYLPHVYAVLSHEGINSTEDTVARASILQSTGAFFSIRGKVEEAETMWKRALAGYEKALEPDHPSTLAVVQNLGMLYYDRGKVEEAETMWKRALAGYEKALKPDHPDTLAVVQNLGMFYYGRGKVEEAETMWRRALAGYEKALEPDHPSTLRVVQNLGLLYHSRGKVEEAETMWRRALAGYEKALEPDHPDTLKVVQNLGLLYHVRGKVEEAETMWKRALAGYEKALEPDHPDTLAVVQNLGMLYYGRGKVEEAETIWKRALAGYEKALEPDHPNILAVVQNLGLLYYSRGKVEEAETMWRRALAGYEKALEPDHPSTLRVVQNLGSLYYSRGKVEEAETMWKRALAGYEKALEPDHPSILKVVQNLGLLYHDRGKVEEAEAGVETSAGGF